MKKLFFALAVVIALSSCGKKQSSVSSTNNDDDSSVVVTEMTYSHAINHYLTKEIGSQYLKGEYCVPIQNIVDVDDHNSKDILVWGDFWVFNYNQVGDTLKCVSGGSHPGLIHVCKTENGFEVTSFDQVEDGSSYLPSAKKIFGEKYDAFHNINSDEQKREEIRTEVLSAFVKEHNISATMYQDYGWPAKKLP